MISAPDLYTELLKRGFTLDRDGPVLVVKPGRSLTADDRVSIKQHKAELLDILDHRCEICLNQSINHSVYPLCLFCQQTHQDSRSPFPYSYDSEESGSESIPDPEREPVDFVQIDTERNLPSVIAAVDESEYIGLDIETTGLNPRTDRIRLLSLSTDRGIWLVDCFRANPVSLFELLSEKTVVGHNLVFDLQFLMLLGFEPGYLSDTMLLSRLVYGTRTPRGFHGLDQCIRRELGKTISKDQQTSDWSQPVLTSEQLSYAAGDVAVLVQLRASLAEHIRDSKQQKAATLEMRCLPAMAWMALNGVGFDRDAWLALAREAEREAARLVQKMDEVVPDGPFADLFGQACNWSSHPQVLQTFRYLGFQMDSVSDEVLATIDHPLATLLRYHRRASKRADTYGTKWLRHVSSDNRVYAGWQQIGADSGRMTCKTPNLQQLPRDPRYRECFKAPEGRVFVVADYSQIELRIAAQIANEKNMKAAYDSGEDLHTRTARKLLSKEDVSKADRQLAKSANFGLLYGMGANGYLAYAKNNYEVDMSFDQAMSYRKAFFDAYPALRTWHNTIGRTQDTAIETRTLTGRRRANVSRFTEKLNTPVQGTGADGIKLALALLWERRQDVPGAFPVLVVHDEIVIECDEEQADEVIPWLETAMRDGMQPLIAPVPVDVEAKAGKTWNK